MNKLPRIIVTSISIMVMMSGQAQESSQRGQGGCIKDMIGQVVCSPPVGGIAVDSIGRILCGKGQCLQDSIGQVVCSSQLGGYAATDSIGQVVCTGGCVPASPAYCQRPRP